MSIMRFIFLILSFIICSSISYSKEDEAIAALVDSFDLKILMPENDNSGLMLKVVSKTDSKIELNKNAFSGTQLWIMFWLNYRDESGILHRTGGSSYHGNSTVGLSYFKKFADGELIPINGPTLALLGDVEGVIKKNNISPDSIEMLIVEFGFTNLIRLPDEYKNSKNVFYPDKFTFSRKEIETFLKLDKASLQKSLTIIYGQ